MFILYHFYNQQSNHSQMMFITDICNFQNNIL